MSNSKTHGHIQIQKNRTLTGVWHVAGRHVESRMWQLQLKLNSRRSLQSCFRPKLPRDNCVIRSLHLVMSETNSNSNGACFSRSNVGSSTSVAMFAALGDTGGGCCGGTGSRGTGGGNGSGSDGSGSRIGTSTCIASNVDGAGSKNTSSRGKRSYSSAEHDVTVIGGGPGGSAKPKLRRMTKHIDEHDCFACDGDALSPSVTAAASTTTATAVGGVLAVTDESKSTAIIDIEHNKPGSSSDDEGGCNHCNFQNHFNDGDEDDDHADDLQPHDSSGDSGGSGGEPENDPDSESDVPDGARCDIRMVSCITVTVQNRLHSRFYVQNSWTGSLGPRDPSAPFWAWFWYDKISVLWLYRLLKRRGHNSVQPFSNMCFCNFCAFGLALCMHCIHFKINMSEKKQ